MAALLAAARHTVPSGPVMFLDTYGPIDDLT
jgi:hypothetical protein